MTPQEMIDVIRAYVDDEKIEYMPYDSNKWIPFGPPTLDFHKNRYRVKPAVFRPHWPAICHAGKSGAILTDSLYATSEDARADINDNGGTFVRLATEYPPVMLP